MTKKLIGHMQCPECDFADAEVGEDKNGHPYRHCPECNAQVFTRGDPVRVVNMKKKMRPVKSAGNPAPVAPAGATTAAPAKKPGALDGLFKS
jgi:hypothetical protein